MNLDLIQSIYALIVSVYSNITFECQYAFFFKQYFSIVYHSYFYNTYFLKESFKLLEFNVFHSRPHRFHTVKHSIL